MANTNDPLAHHSTDVLPMENYGVYTVSSIPTGEKRGYESNDTGYADSGSDIQTGDMV